LGFRIVLWVSKKFMITKTIPSNTGGREKLLFIY
jgi:hypothetical protein